MKAKLKAKKEAVAVEKKPASRQRADELKRRCVDDFKRLKISFADLLKEVGSEETLQFAVTLHAIDSIGLKFPW